MKKLFSTREESDEWFNYVFVELNNDIKEYCITGSFHTKVQALKAKAAAGCRIMTRKQFNNLNKQNFSKNI